MEENKFKVGEFEGPLDLLLFLIKKQEINIYDIPIAKITEQYLSYLAYASQIELDNLTDFYLMAATLLYIKSRMLLPVEVNLDEELEDPRTELVEKLIEYQKYKKLSELMSEQEDKSEWLLERQSSQTILPFPDKDIWQQIDVWDLLKTFSSLVSSLTSEQIIDLYEEVTINEKITLIRELIDKKEELLFTDILVKSHSLLEIICSFLAILEMVKSKEIIVFQNKMFGDIRIKSLKKTKALS
jgi:segregation and condensation protein A